MIHATTRNWLSIFIRVCIMVCYRNNEHLKSKQGRGSCQYILSIYRGNLLFMSLASHRISSTQKNFRIRAHQFCFIRGHVWAHVVLLMALSKSAIMWENAHILFVSVMCLLPAVFQYIFSTANNVSHLLCMCRLSLLKAVCW